MEVSSFFKNLQKNDQQAHFMLFDGMTIVWTTG